ncbi:MAG: UDP-N-acetylglucosamine--N-acetylmuramyl-(pentapeptide) pyrophosphoryl-undecaprenol N-acetylglucosamine transferase [Pseudomonadota bacterium]
MFLLTAGGTGGHLFPAQAVAAELSARGHAVSLITDARAKTLVADFPADAIHFLPAATPSVKNPVKFARAAAINAAALFQARAILNKEKPLLVLGFGGYPTVPPLFAAKLKGLPRLIHEANAVMGRANRVFVSGGHVATAFPDVRNVPSGAQSVTHVGMPVRPAVVEARSDFAPPTDEFRLLVFGGSQGAHVFSELLPPAIAALADDERQRLSLTAQIRPEDMQIARAKLEALCGSVNIAPFFNDLPHQIARAHLIIARAGASTVTELSVIGRPSLLVPLPGALDQDQAGNANALAVLGGAKRLDQAGLTPDVLAAELAALMANPEKLGQMATASRELARPDAASRLADLAENVAKRIA